MPKIQELLKENAPRNRSEGTEKVCTSLPPPQRAPWLIFFSHGKHQKLHTFVSLSEKRVYVREIEEMHRSYYYSHCDSWLFMSNLSYRDYFLLNLTSRKKIMLPPPPRGSRYITEAVITSSPASKGSGMILSYRRDSNVFLFHRLKENKWEMVKCNCKDRIRSLVKCGGTIYALAGSQLAVVDVVPYPKVVPLPVEEPAVPLDVVFIYQLLESCSELFLLVKYIVCFTSRLQSFVVYKMDFSEMKFLEVNSLGDRAFFFGASFRRDFSSGTSCSASRAGITANCIYFTNFDYSGIFKFDMADRSVSRELSWPSIPKPWSEVAWINILDS